MQTPQAVRITKGNFFFVASCLCLPTGKFVGYINTKKTKLLHLYFMFKKASFQTGRRLVNQFHPAHHYSLYHLVKPYGLIFYPAL